MSKTRELPIYIEKTSFGVMNWKKLEFTFKKGIDLTAEMYRAVNEKFYGQLKQEALFPKEVNITHMHDRTIKFLPEFYPIEGTFNKNTFVASLLDSNISSQEWMIRGDHARQSGRPLTAIFYEMQGKGHHSNTSFPELIAAVENQQPLLGSVRQISNKYQIEILSEKNGTAFCVFNDPKAKGRHTLSQFTYVERGEAAVFPKKQNPYTFKKTLDELIRVSGESFNPKSIIWNLKKAVKHPAFLLSFALPGLASADDKIAAIKHELNGLGWGFTGAEYGALVGMTMGATAGVIGGPVGMVAGGGTGALTGGLIGGITFAALGPLYEQLVSTSAHKSSPIGIGLLGMVVGFKMGGPRGALIGGGLAVIATQAGTIELIEKGVNGYSRIATSTSLEAACNKINNWMKRIAHRFEAITSSSKVEEVSLQTDTPKETSSIQKTASVARKNLSFFEDRTKKLATEKPLDFKDRLAAIFTSGSSSGSTTLVASTASTLPSTSFITAPRLSAHTMVMQASRTPVTLSMHSLPTLSSPVSRLTPTLQTISSTRLPPAVTAMQTITPATQFFNRMQTQSTYAAQWVSDRFNL